MKLQVVVVVLALSALDIALSSETPECPPVTCKDDEKLCIESLPFQPPKCPTNATVTKPCPKIRCVKKLRDKPNANGKVCETICPTLCGPDQIRCPGGHDQFGCRKQDTCMTKPACGPPPKCPPKEFDYRGCRKEPWCSVEEQFCPGRPKTATEKCKPVGTCIPRFLSGIRGKKGHSNCRNHCPVKCGPHERLCRGYFERNACRARDKCVKIGADNKCPAKEFDSRGCKTIPRLQVKPCQKLCPIGVDRDGCHMGFKIVDDKAPCPKLRLPPPSQP